MKKFFGLLMVPVVAIALSVVVPTTAKAQDDKKDEKKGEKKGKKKKKKDGDETK